jgi:hypothetical protein
MQLILSLGDSLSYSWLIVLLATIEGGLLIACKPAFGGTTLVSAWWWAVAALVGVASTEVLLTVSLEPLWARSIPALRFASAALTFCPMMAVLGAKRPQDRAWQFIVLSMWGIVTLPAIESLALRPGQALSIQGVRFAFLAGLILLGVLNWLPTRLWATAILVGLGQATLFAPYVGLELVEPPPLLRALAGIWFVFATAIFLWKVRLGPRHGCPGNDRVWRDFRDQFGALWALRVLERVNASVVMNQWPFRLFWTGFKVVSPSIEIAESDHTSEQQQALNIVIDNLMRRFVSSEWIAKRRENRVH